MKASDEICRVKRSKEETKKVYNRLSKWYDILAGHYEAKFRAAGLKMLNANPGEKILEIGFGTGHCTLDLAQSVGDGGIVYGIDISEGMLDITAGRIAEHGLSSRVELTLGDAAALPYPGNFFDAVFMTFALELFDTDEIPLVLNQCHRVLKNNGRICVVAMSKNDGSKIMLNLYEWMHRNFEKYTDCRPIYVEKSIKVARFSSTDSKVLTSLGLPVEIVLAVKHAEIRS